jgi:hypothetical protein
MKPFWDSSWRNIMRIGKLGCALAGAVLCLQALAADPGTGTLVLDVKPFDAEMKIKKKVRKVLEAGGIFWGVNGEHLVMSQVLKKYVNARLSNTPMGEQEEIELAAGEYQITCIGYEVTKTKTTDVEDELDASAYINEDVLMFTIRPSKVTRLEIVPSLRKAKANFVIKVFIADSTITVFEEDIAVREAMVTRRTNASIGWGDYDGRWKAD